MKRNIFKKEHDEFVYKDKTLVNKFYIVSELEHRRIQQLSMSTHKISDIITVKDMIKTGEKVEEDEVLGVYEVKDSQRFEYHCIDYLENLRIEKCN